MMPDSTRHSDAILREARQSLITQRDGGYHRRKGSIGRGSAELKQRNLMTRIKLIGGSLAVIMFAALATGIAIGGIGFTGVMVVGAMLILASLPEWRLAA